MLAQFKKKQYLCNVKIKQTNKQNQNDMKTITMNQFLFKFVYPGHYVVRYTTPKRGDYWRALITDMTLIDATKNEEEPRQKDLARLRKSVQGKGTHYSKGGAVIGEFVSMVSQNY